jgi:hypothetical protein
MYSGGRIKFTKVSEDGRQIEVPLSPRSSSGRKRDFFRTPMPKKEIFNEISRALTDAPKTPSLQEYQDLLSKLGAYFSEYRPMEDLSTLSGSWIPFFDNGPVIDGDLMKIEEGRIDVNATLEKYNPSPKLYLTGKELMMPLLHGRIAFRASNDEKDYIIWGYVENNIVTFDSIGFSEDDAFPIRMKYRNYTSY